MQTRPWLPAGSPALDQQTIRSWRLLRATVVGLCALLLSYGGHRLAGGMSVGPGQLVAPTVAMMAGAWVLSRRRFTVPRLVALLAAGQLLLHAWFSLSALPATPDVMGGREMADMGPAASGHQLAVMVGGHVLAALVTAVLLRQGDLALLRLVVTVVRRLLGVRMGEPASPPRPAVLRKSRREDWPRLSLVHACAQPHRGPPTHLAV